MPNYKTHIIYDTIPLPLVLVVMCLKYSGNPADLLPMVGFLAWWALHTRVITPDIDTRSTPSKLLGPVGWVIRIFSSHRGMFHSPVFWAVYFVLQYYFIGWWTLGGVYPVYCHIYLDKTVTSIKRIKNKIIRKITGAF